jgi:anti-anti-sigma regulatory factor
LTLAARFTLHPSTTDDDEVVRSPRPQARKVLELTGLDEVLRIED